MPEDFHIQNGYGQSIRRPTREQMQSFLFELDEEDIEHGRAWLSDSDGNVLEYHGDGVLTFEAADLQQRHLAGVSRERVLELWVSLSIGDRERLEHEPWVAGKAPLPSWYAQWQSEVEEQHRHEEREFWESLGPERPDERCREAGCTRGAVRWSLFCRRHTFENMKKKPCPYED